MSLYLGSPTAHVALLGPYVSLPRSSGRSMVVPEAFWAPPEPSWRPTKPRKMQQKHCILQCFVLLRLFAYAPRSEAQKGCKRRPTGAQNEPQAQPKRPQEQPKRPQEHHRRPPERPKRYPTSPSERFSLPNGVHLAPKSPPEASMKRFWTPREAIFHPPEGRFS